MSVNAGQLQAIIDALDSIILNPLIKSQWAASRNQAKKMGGAKEFSVKASGFTLIIEIAHDDAEVREALVKTGIPVLKGTRDIRKNEIKVTVRGDTLFITLSLARKDEK